MMEEPQTRAEESLGQLTLKCTTEPLVPEWAAEMAVEEEDPVPIDPFAIAQSILDLIYSFTASANFTGKQMRIFAFIAQALHDQIEPHLEGLVSQICDNYGNDIAMIIVDQQLIGL
jgi:hypothetical protein